MTPDEAREAAVALLERMLEHGTWYSGAIELHGGPLLGDDLEEEAERIVQAARGLA